MRLPRSSIKSTSLADMRGFRGDALGSHAPGSSALVSSASGSHALSCRTL